MSKKHGSSIVHFSVEDREGVKELSAEVGRSLFHVLKDGGVKINGACDGHMGCGTCHVYIDPATFKRIDPASAKELDVLDYAFGLKPTSRLSCGVLVDKALEGARIRLPRMDRNVLSEEDLV